MTTRLRRSAYRTTDVERGADVDMARYRDLVLASRRCALDHDTALCLCGILILPARQVVDMMPAGQLNIDILNDSIALLVAWAATFILAIVIAAFLHPVAGLGAIDGLMETVRMALVHTRVAARKTLSTQKITSSFR